jgi:hypothetical protein
MPFLLEIVLSNTDATNYEVARQTVDFGDNEEAARKGLDAAFDAAAEFEPDDVSPEA